MTVNYSSDQVTDLGATYLLTLLGGKILGEQEYAFDLLLAGYCPHRHLELIQAAIEQYRESRRLNLRFCAEPLTHREFQVLIWLAEGCSNREIGEIVCITEATVKSHVERICRKFNVKNRAGAVAMAFRLGIVA